MVLKDTKDQHQQEFLQLSEKTISINSKSIVIVGLETKIFGVVCGAEHMDELPGALGTSASLALRLGQAIFSVASLLFMCLDIAFYSYPPFCFLVSIMGLVIPWSLTLALVDAFSVFVKRSPRQRGMMFVIVIGDWVLSFLSLAASCSAASAADLMLSSGGSLCTPNICSRYQLSAAMAFLAWFLSQASSLFNLWLLPCL